MNKSKQKNTPKMCLGPRALVKTQYKGGGGVPGGAAIGLFKFICIRGYFPSN